MNYTFFFFICASIAFGLSVISICTAPVITYYGNSWGILNCKKFSDQYDYIKKNTPEDKEKLNKEKMGINICKRQKAMHGLEYSSLICDVFFGGVCALLGLLHYLEVGKSIEKKTGLIGIIAGTIGFVLTLVYVIFSAYIFNNDSAGEEKKFPNGAYLKWTGYKYILNYDEDKLEDDPYIGLIKYRELGQRQYNYDSELYKFSSETAYTDCKLSLTVADNNHKYSTGHYLNCDYIWVDDYEDSISNKYIYDKWITTLILSVFIVVANIGIILFGFFLFTQSESSPGSVPLPMSSVNAA